MDVRLERVAKSLTTFFDNDLSGTYLELSRAAKIHMDRFRSFLHTYYIESHGFWPPSGFASSFSLRRSLYRSMYKEFRALYQYLVDLNSTPGDLRNTQSAQGAICTWQNVRGFDTRYRLETLPHPLPLLPKLPEHSAPLGFTIRKRRMEREARYAALARSLSDASNLDRDLTKSRLVRCYTQFEKQTIDTSDTVDPIEGRKVRWILIYAIFQILASVISAPKEVTHADGLSYPLCCQRPKTMPWADEIKRTISSNGRSLRINATEDKETSGAKRDSGTDMDRASLTSLTRSSSTDTWSTTSAQSLPSTSTTPRSSRTPSLLRFIQNPRKSAINLSGTSSSANSARPKSVSFHDMLASGYGNASRERTNSTPKAVLHRRVASHSDQQSVARNSINNSAFVGTAASRPRPISFHGAPQKFTPLLPSASNPLPSRSESPTRPSACKSSTSSRDSSRTSVFSRITSDTTNSSNTEPMEHQRNDSIDTTTTELPTPTPTPTPKPSPEFVEIPTKRPLSLSSASRSSSLEYSSISILSTVAGPDKYLSLPGSTGSGRMGLPPPFYRSYSGGSSSTTSVNVIREEVEVS
jgi:hypothetical protein